LFDQKILSCIGSDNGFLFHQFYGEKNIAQIAW